VTRQPILFLDVDGVLNVLGEDYEKSQVELPGDRFTHLIHPSIHTLPFMRWAWDVFDVRWCTAWGPDANVIAKWAGLPEKPCAADVRSASLEWKLDAVRQTLGRRKHIAVWIEDGIGPVAERWAARKKDFFYVHTDHKIGVTKAHAGFLADILNLPMRAWL
jgi:hypothetical protein